MDHSVMFLVLTHLAECGSATSREVAQEFSFISRKYASLVLTRCSRRGFVSREPYKQGKEHGYVYKLANKGAEWILYKISQKAKDDQYDRKPPKQVGNEDIPAQNVMMLDPNETRPNKKAFTFPRTELSTLTDLNLYVNAYQSQKQQLNASEDFLVDLALLRAGSRADSACYLWWEQVRKSSGRNQKEKTVSSSGSLRGSWSTASETRPRSKSRSGEGQLQGFELGLKLGILIGEKRQLIQNQNALLKAILNEKFRSRNFNNTHISTLQTASAKTPKIERSMEVASKPVPTPQNITVEEPGEDDDDWAETNCWWRHLPKSYIR